MGLKAKMGIRATMKSVAKLRPVPPTESPPRRPFRPITPDAFKVTIPKIRKVRTWARAVEPSTKVLLVLPVREKKELQKVALELGVSVNTVLRLSYKRFLRMPEVPLSKSQQRIWHLGIRRDQKAWLTKAKKYPNSREAVAWRDLLMTDIEKTHNRLGVATLEHKAIEVFATNEKYEPTRLPFKEPGKRKGKEGNPHGYNQYTGRAPARDTNDGRAIPRVPAVPVHGGSPVPVVSTAVPVTRRRLFVRVKAKT